MSNRRPFRVPASAVLACVGSVAALAMGCPPEALTPLEPGPPAIEVIAPTGADIVLFGTCVDVELRVSGERPLEWNVAHVGGSAIASGTLLFGNKIAFEYCVDGPDDASLEASALDGQGRLGTATIALTSCADADSDGYGPCGGDCDDLSAGRAPNIAETCDGIDNNCDGETDESLSWDEDEDGHFRPGSCASPADDCNDRDPQIGGACTHHLVGPWQGFGGNAARNGWFVGRVGDALLAEDWTANLDGVATQVAVEAGLVLVTLVDHEVWGSDRHLVALAADSGELLWGHTFPGATGLSPPTVDDGVVYIHRESDQNEQIWAIEAQNGEVLWLRTLPRATGAPLAPLVWGKQIWLRGNGAAGALVGLSTATGALHFSTPVAPRLDWTPSFAADTVLCDTHGTISGHDPASGKTRWSVDLWPPTTDPSPGRAAIAAGGRLFVADGLAIAALSIAEGDTLWSLHNALSGTPAADPHSVFAVTGAEIVEYDAVTGAERRRYRANEPLTGQPIITDDAVIAAGAFGTYIFSRETTLLIDAAPVGGALSLANGRLYTAGAHGVRSFRWQPPTATAGIEAPSP